MWSGSNSGPGESFPSQWAVGAGPAPSGGSGVPFFNVPHEQVDWASLAQQWIKMKEEAPQSGKEGGEAPMDITKDENPRPPDWNQPPDGDWSSNWGWDQGGAWLSWGTNAGSPVIPTPAVPSPKVSSPPNFVPTGYTSIPDPPSIPQSTPVFPYTPPQPAPPPESYTRNYWTSSAHSDSSKSPSSWEQSHPRKRQSAAPSEPPPELDAAKRKQLPAWIREGLEKMEREKQKKAEMKKIEKNDKDPIGSQLNDLSNSNGLPELPRKSKFDSESEEEEEVPPAKSPEKDTKKKFEWTREPSPPPHRTKEQILQSVMSDVRKVLTQILMEVTTEEIEKAVDDINKYYTKKAPAATIRKTPAFTSLTGKLGLGIYGSESESDSDQERGTNDGDSDQELQERIDRLKNEFVAVEENIEKEAVEQEERERKQLMRGTQGREESTEEDSEDQVQQSKSEGEAEPERKPSPSSDPKVGSDSKTRRGSSSTSSSSRSRSPSPYYKKKDRHRHRGRSRYSRSRSRSRDKRHRRRRSSSKRRRSGDRRRRHSSSSDSSERYSRRGHRR